MEKISNVITLQGVIPLGKQGENGVVEIIFPQPPGLLAENWTLLHLRATDAAAYPVPLEKRDGALVWSISSGDTAIDGLGKAELICTSKDGQILKSRTYFTKVAQSLDPGQSVPDPVQPWYEKLLSELQGVVKTVNGVAPDETGNVESNTGGSGGGTPDVDELDALSALMDTGVIDPAADENGALYTDDAGNIYSL